MLQCNFADNKLIITIMKNEEFINRMHDYKLHLKTISNGLVEMAKAAGREEYTINQLLRECYNLVGIDIDTAEGWKAKGYSIRKGQHAYLFWDDNNEVAFMFAKEQMMYNGTPKTTLFVVQTVQLRGDGFDDADIEGNKFFKTRKDANDAAKKRFQDEIDNEDTWTHDIYARWKEGDENYKVTQDDLMGSYSFVNCYDGWSFEIYVVTLEGTL